MFGSDGLHWSCLCFEQMVGMVLGFLHKALSSTVENRETDSSQVASHGVAIDAMEWKPGYEKLGAGIEIWAVSVLILQLQPGC